jgi:2-polyprenyl-3-methyl-5-hydroxy-6-metoxy-1,4-benzoquinol methylase
MGQFDPWLAPQQEIMPPQTAKPIAAAPDANNRASSLTDETYRQLKKLMNAPQSVQQLARMLRLLSIWRSSLITNTLVKNDGAIVQSGPFKGMAYVTGASEGSTSSRLLGCYETALHPIIEKIIRRGYAQVIDVGCAEGYYAVGLARRMPQTQVLARDMNPAAQKKCTELAAMNNVSAQVQVGGQFDHADFDLCTKAKTVVICDIEGAEAELLNPALAKGLLSADILVEVHDCFTPGLSAQIAQRFEATHNVRHIPRANPTAELPAWFEDLSDLDRILAIWEWRMGPTPWLWMTRKRKGGGDDSAPEAQ